MSSVDSLFTPSSSFFCFVLFVFFSCRLSGYGNVGLGNVGRQQYGLSNVDNIQYGNVGAMPSNMQFAGIQQQQQQDIDLDEMQFGNVGQQYGNVGVRQQFGNVGQQFGQQLPIGQLQYGLGQSNLPLLPQQQQYGLGSSMQLGLSNVGVGALMSTGSKKGQTTMAAPIYAESMIVPKIITQPILRPHMVQQPILQQQLIQQPIVETRQVIQPVIRRIITQPIIRPEIYESTTIQPSLKTETIVQPHLVQQTIVTPQMQNVMEEAQPIQEQAKVNVQQVTTHTANTEHNSSDAQMNESEMSRASRSVSHSLLPLFVFLFLCVRLLFSRLRPRRAALVSARSDNSKQDTHHTAHTATMTTLYHSVTLLFLFLRSFITTFCFRCFYFLFLLLCFSVHLSFTPSCSPFAERVVDEQREMNRNARARSMCPHALFRHLFLSFDVADIQRKENIICF